MKTHFKKRRTGASMTELGLLVGLIAILLISSLSGVGTTLTRLFGVTENALGNAATGVPIATAPNTPAPEPEPDPTYASCQEWFDSTDSNFTNNGVNEIYPNGASTPINVYCQGAMTLILAQYENDPVTNWNEGIQADYDPTLATQKGFALSSSEIPSHSKIYFGQNLASPAYCLTMTYHSVGDFVAWDGATPITYADCTTPTTRYFLYRSATGYYNGHNPEDPSGMVSNTNSGWEDTLALDLYQNSSGRATGRNYDWGFSPNIADPNDRGYSYQGGFFQDIANPGVAWTVWVE